MLNAICHALVGGVYFCFGCKYLHHDDYLSCSLAYMLVILYFVMAMLHVVETEGE
jgi:hypothetical protein